MAYTDIFSPVDEYILMFDRIANNLDPFMQSRQAGFVCISAVTAFELAIKDIFIEFAEQRDMAFGNYVTAKTGKLNGNIGLDKVKEYVSEFGAGYSDKFKLILDAAEKESIENSNGSIKSDYGSLISIRHAIVHRAEFQITYAEAKKNYQQGKLLLDCLHTCFQS